MSLVDVAPVSDQVDDNATCLRQNRIDYSVISNAELKQSFELACESFMVYCLEILRKPPDFVQDALSAGLAKPP